MNVYVSDFDGTIDVYSTARKLLEDHENMYYQIFNKTETCQINSKNMGKLVTDFQENGHGTIQLKETDKRKLIHISVAHLK